MSDSICVDKISSKPSVQNWKKKNNLPLEIKFGVLKFLCVHDGETRQTQNETEIMTPFSL